MRRFVDLTVGSVIALLVLPVIVVLAGIGAVVFRANPFFVQDRVGRGGRLFRFWKLRSLPPEAPAYADKYALKEVPIPRWGRLIRKLHLDELPQLLHVPQGRMSLIGPRPEMAFLHEQMPERFAEQRVSVRPGCTGLWQISVGSQKLILETPEYDEFYLRHRSWRLDLWVFVRTVLMMARLSRPVTLEQVPGWARRDAVQRRGASADRALRDFRLSRARTVSRITSGESRAASGRRTRTRWVDHGRQPRPLG